jgi:TrmH family RNA methyltransferase
VTVQTAGGKNILRSGKSSNGLSIRTFKSRKPTLLIFGNEVKGVPRGLLKAADAIIEIPMHGKKESLNVSVTAGIILFSIR